MVVKIKKPLTIIATVMLTLLMAVSTAVPAFAEEFDTAQSNAQFEIVDPSYESDTNNYVTLPDAPVKDGYTFKGWSIDGSTELHSAGESIVNNDGHKMQLQPVYKSSSVGEEVLAGIIFCIFCVVIICVVVFLPLDLGKGMENGRFPFNSTVYGIVCAVLLFSPVLIGVLARYGNSLAQNIAAAIGSAFR